MKLFKYSIFLLILFGIFVVVYRNCNKKGFRRLFVSIKLAIIIAAILSGLIGENAEAVEHYGTTINPSMERVLSNEEFNLLDEQVILVKAEGNPGTPPNRGSGPSNFPVSPPSGGRPSRPVYGYRTPPKVVDQGLGVGGNPAGAGNGSGAPEFDDQCPVPKKQESKTFDYDYRSNVPKNKKQVTEQCELSEDTPREINEKFESNSVKKLVKRALANQRVKKEYEVIKKRINEGVNPIDIGSNTAAVANNKVLIKGAHGRYLVEVSANQVNVLGIGARGNKKNIQTFERLMNEMYDVNLQY